MREPNKQNRLLIIAPAWIGDMVMAQTLFKLIKQRQPTAIIDVVAPKSTSSLLEHMPEVNQIITVPFVHGKLDLLKRFLFGIKLQRNHYNKAIVLPNSIKSALIPFFACIKTRTGWNKEPRYLLTNDIRKMDKQKYPLMIQRFAALGLDRDEPLPEKLPWPKLTGAGSSLDIRHNNHISKPNPASRASNVLCQDLTPLPLALALCPGAEYGPAKRWPAEYFATVAKKQIEAGWQVWIFGGKKDQAIASEIDRLTDNRCTNLTGKTTITEAIQLLSLAKLVITNDTGLMHIAAAVNCRLIVLYGSSSPKFTPPLTDKATILSLNLPCSPCFKRECPLKHYNCLRDLKPEMVMEHIQKKRAK